MPIRSTLWCRVQDWSYVITDKEDLRRQSLNDLKKQNTYFFTTGMTIARRAPHAGGFIKGKNLAELFQQLCAGYTDSLNFTRDLRIPFACVATDIIGNNEVVFHSGRCLRLCAPRWPYPPPSHQ